MTASEMDRRTPPLAPGRRLQLGLQASLASARPGRPYSEGLRHVGPPPGARVRSVSGWLRQKQNAKGAPAAHPSRQLVRTLIDPIDAGKSALGTPLAHRRSGFQPAGVCDERRPRSVCRGLSVAVSLVCLGRSEVRTAKKTRIRCSSFTGKADRINGEPQRPIFDHKYGSPEVGRYSRKEGRKEGKEGRKIRCPKVGR